jgi:hypothetical protein
MIVHDLSEQRPGGCVHLGVLAAPVGLRAQLARRAIAAQYLLNTRVPDAKHVGKGTLGAQPPLGCRHKLLTELDQRGCHMCKASAVAPDDQV